MSESIYSLLIYPLTVVLEWILNLSFRFTDDYGISIILLSIAVNILLLPIYYMADGWKNKDKQLRDRMQPEIDAIKKSYQGKERYFYIQTIYRRYNFHPLSSVKSSAGFLIQIPFFIAAFYLLKSYASLTGASFGIIADLSAPDRLLYGLNALPFVMTIVNIASAYFNSQAMNKIEKYQFWAMAGLFFFILYREPSALIIYWTVNNLFSLCKNVLTSKLLKANKIAKEIAVKRSLFQNIYANVIPLKWQASINNVISKHGINSNHTTIQLNSVTIKGIVICSFLLFLFPTLSIISSSPHEFSDHAQLIGIMLYLFFISIGVLVFIVKQLYDIPRTLAFLSLFVTLYFLTNIYIVSGDYGLMDFFTLHTPDTLQITSWNIVLDMFIFFALAIFSFQIISSNKFQLIYVDRLLQIIIFMLLFSSIFYSNSIITSIKYNNGDFFCGNQEASFTPKFHFSKYGRNVLIIFFDRFMGGYVPDIFKDLPSLKDDLSGFTWYANTLSFGSYTVAGLPPIYAGYKYTNVVEMQKTGYKYSRGFRSPSDKLMQDRFLPSTRFMLDKFLAKGYRTYLTNPSFIDAKTIKNLHKNSYCDNLVGKYRKIFLKNQNSHFIHKKISPEELAMKYLIPFGLFKIFPPSNRIDLYNEGKWWDLAQQSLNTSAKIRKYVNNLSLAHAYPLISTVNDKIKGSYMFTSNFMIHDPYAALDDGQFLKVTPKGGIGNQFNTLGNSNSISKETVHRFKDWWSTVHFFASKEALKRTGAWVKWMKKNRVFDNTMIIVVADHGAVGSWDPMLPRTGKGSRNGKYHPIFMVKDFNASGAFKADYSFMTHADVPSFALSAIEPRAKKKYSNDKSNGFRIYTPKGNLTVYDNIFNVKNWIYKH